MRNIYLLCLLLLSGAGLRAQTQILAPLPPHGSPFTGNVRGYWFQSPTCFTITGLEVAQEAGAGTQNIAVMRLYAAPPIYSATTNAFTPLFVTQNNPATGIIPVNIQVEAGDFIMILGQRGTVNSYSASGSFTTTINGQTVNIFRSGMQYNLTTTFPQDLWSQASGSVSRVHMYYDSVLTFAASATQTGLSSFDFTNGADTSFLSVWDYGDGSPLDTSATGSHTYATGGVYNVCSYITTGCGTDTVCTTVSLCGPDPVSAFSAATAGFNVAFTDSSTDAVSWMWDFGDGNTATTQNPSHTYSAMGWYNVCLTTANSCGVMDTLCDSVLICIPPSAAMSYVVTGGDSVYFIDASTNATTWMWDFGDGTTDSTQNPLHVYTASGTYTVCLSTSNLCGSGLFCDTLTVCVVPLSAGFTYISNQFNVSFTNSSAGATGYQWDFGDGGSSTTANPSHTYTANGTYTVCLTVRNDCSEMDSECDTILINVVGVAQSLPGYAITVAPNPVRDAAVLTVNAEGVQGAYTVDVMDVRGARVLAAEGELNAGTRLDVGKLAHGIYVYRVMQEGVCLGTGRMVVE